MKNLNQNNKIWIAGFFERINLEKMNKLERETYQILIKQGYQVEKAIKTQWHRTDLFNLWDFVALNNQHIRFIQVGVKYFSGRSKEWQERALNFPCPPNATKEYWLKRGNNIKIMMINEELKRYLDEIRKAREYRKDNAAK